jgi:hypothetical protein
MEFRAELVRSTSPFRDLLFYISITIIINIITLFKKNYYLNRDSGFVKHVGYTGNLQVLQCRHGINVKAESVFFCRYVSELCLYIFHASFSNSDQLSQKSTV